MSRQKGSSTADLAQEPVAGNLTDRGGMPVRAVRCVGSRYTEKWWGSMQESRLVTFPKDHQVHASAMPRGQKG